MRKYVKICLLVVAVVVGVLVYITAFTPRERRARYVRNNQHKIVIGMTEAAVRKLLSEPDAMYVYDLPNSSQDDTINVLQYYRGFGSADDLRILTKNGHVVEVISNR